MGRSPQGRSCLPKHQATPAKPFGSRPSSSYVSFSRRAVRKASSGVLRPFEDLLAPVHPHIAVHLPGEGHFPLGGVPIGIVGPGAVELSIGIDVFPGDLAVLGEGRAAPGREAGIFVIAGIVSDEVHGKLAADDELFQKGGRARPAVLPDREGDLERRDLAEVEVRAQIRLPVQAWIVAGFRVIVEPVLDEIAKKHAAAGPPAPERAGPDAPVDAELGQDPFRVPEVEGIQPQRKGILLEPPVLEGGRGSA